MIQPAAPSASSSLALAIGSQGAPSDDAAISGGFAAVLTASAGAGHEPVVGAGASAALAAVTVPGLATGNPAGKSLPLELPLAAPQQAGEPTLTSPTLTSPAAPAQILLPGLVVPAGAQLAQASTKAPSQIPAERSTADNLATAAAARLSRTPLLAARSSAAGAKPAKDGSAVENTDTAEADTQPGAASALLPAVLSDPAAAALQPAAIPVQAPVISQQAPEAETSAVYIPSARTKPDATPGGSPALPAQAPQSVIAMPSAAPQAEAVVLPPTAGQSAPQPGANARPVTAEASAEAAPVVINIALPQANGIPPLRAGARTINADLPQIDAGIAQAPLARQEGDQPAGQQPRLATDPASPLPAAAQDVATTIVRASHSASKQGDRPSAPAPAPAETALQPAPVLSSTDPHAASQPITAPAPPSATTVAHGGHDFATLVDRLVEAREAASPQPVSATVSHGEFGKVTLRFDQDASGLSVAMSSADPDFARAVQASAASQTAADTGTAPRQDAPSQQQTSGSLAGQAQSHGQSQTSARDERNTQQRSEPGVASNAARQRAHDESTDSRDGIYA